MSRSFGLPVVLAGALLRGGAAHPPPAAAYLFSFAGACLAPVTGWPGGELVGRLGIGVDEGANLDAPRPLSGRPAYGASYAD